MAHPIPMVLTSLLDQISLTGFVTLSLLVTSMAAPVVAYGDDPLDCFDLLRAAQHNDTAVLRRALQASVPVDCRNDRQQTPLLVATMHNSVDAARLLIEVGADVNAQDTFYGMRAIDMALSNDHYDVARLLLERGSKGASSVLMSGIQAGDAALVKAALGSSELTRANLNAAEALAKRQNKTEIAGLIAAKSATPLT